MTLGMLQVNTIPVVWITSINAKILFAFSIGRSVIQIRKFSIVMKVNMTATSGEQFIILCLALLRKIKKYFCRLR